MGMSTAQPKKKEMARPVCVAQGVCMRASVHASERACERMCACARA